MKENELDDPIAIVLTAIHAAVNKRHQRARSRLLESLTDPALKDNQIPLGRSVRHYLVGGVGLSTAAMLLILWFAGHDPAAAAMERVAKALDQVMSYTFRMEDVYTSRKAQGRQVKHAITGRWQTQPIGLHAMNLMTETLGTNTATPGVPTTIVDLEETHSEGSRGIIIDHLKKQYWRINEQFVAESVPGGSPQVVIYKVRQRRGRIVRELGEREVDGVMVRGFELLLDNDKPAMELGPATPESNMGRASGWDWRNIPVEVWVDPQTDLPVEFRCVRRGADFESIFRFTDLKWNVKFPSDAFETDPPKGYTELEGPPLAEQE